MSCAIHKGQHPHHLRVVHVTEPRQSALSPSAAGCLQQASSAISTSPPSTHMPRRCPGCACAGMEPGRPPACAKVSSNCRQTNHRCDWVLTQTRPGCRCCFEQHVELLLSWVASRSLHAAQTGMFAASAGRFRKHVKPDSWPSLSIDKTAVTTYHNAAGALLCSCAWGLP
jgi:hypothetical protein